jgi:hypothetical protein
VSSGAQTLKLSKPAGELLGYDDFQKNPVLSNEDITSLIFNLRLKPRKPLQIKVAYGSSLVHLLRLICSVGMNDRRFKAN